MADNVAVPPGMVLQLGTDVIGLMLDMDAAVASLPPGTSVESGSLDFTINPEFPCAGHWKITLEKMP